MRLQTSVARLTEDSARPLTVVGNRNSGTRSWLMSVSAVNTFEVVMGFPSILPRSERPGCRARGNTRAIAGTGAEAARSMPGDTPRGEEAVFAHDQAQHIQCTSACTQFAEENSTPHKLDRGPNRGIWEREGGRGRGGGGRLSIPDSRVF